MRKIPTLDDDGQVSGAGGWTHIFPRTVRYVRASEDGLNLTR